MSPRNVTGRPGFPLPVGCPSMSGPEAITVEKLERVTDEFVEAWARLIPQLSGAPAPAREQLEWVVGHEANTVLVARDEDGAIVGTTTLVTFPLATGLRAWIHAVAVAEAH